MEAADQDLMNLLESLDFEEPKVVSVKDLDAEALIKAYHVTTRTLLARGETLSPTTEDGRELHSQRSALLVELRKRGML